MSKKFVSLITLLAMLLFTPPPSLCSLASVYAASQVELSEETTVVSIIAEKCTIYTEASSTGEKVATVYKNSTFPYISTKSVNGTDWYQIYYGIYGNCETGWVVSSTAQKTTVSCHMIYSDSSPLCRLVTPKESTYLYSETSTYSEKVCRFTTTDIGLVIDDNGEDEFSSPWLKVKFGSYEGWIITSNVSVTNVCGEIADRVFSDDNIPVIYLSPSRQEGNTYSTGGTTEYRQMNKVAIALKEILEENYVCEVYIADYEEKIWKNERPLTAAELGADIYLAIHSNSTSPSNPKYGTLAFYYPGCAQSELLGENIVKEINAISPFDTKSSGNINGMRYNNRYGYAEVRLPASYGMVSLLLEVQYHDHDDTAKWIINNTDKIAQAIANGLVETFNLAEKTEDTSTSESAIEAVATTDTTASAVSTSDVSPSDVSASDIETDSSSLSTVQKVSLAMIAISLTVVAIGFVMLLIFHQKQKKRSRAAPK